MKFGFNIPNSGPLAEPNSIREMVQRGENLGYSLIGVPDHVIIPCKINSPYPYTEDGKQNFFKQGDTLEAIALLASIASMTTTARLLTSVLVIPYREPIYTAKALATIDIMSGGRITLGCGAGWMEEEFLLVAPTQFRERGRVTDEYINAFRAMWTSEEPVFNGKYVKFSDVYFRPSPVQKPHPPIWIGGDSIVALRRAASLGDGWYPVGLNPKFPLNTVKRYAERIDKLRDLTEIAGRDPSAVELSFWPLWYRPNKSVHIDGGARHLLMGSYDETASDVFALSELGIKSIVFNFLSSDLNKTLDAMEMFSDQVIRQVNGQL